MSRPDKITLLWVILNEETLSTVTDKTGKVLTFPSYEQANRYACRRLELWSPIKVHTNHPFIHHEVNTVEL